MQTKVKDHVKYRRTSPSGKEMLGSVLDDVYEATACHKFPNVLLDVHS